MVCIGAKSEEQSITTVQIVVQKLKKRGIKIKKDAVITIQNIVASGKLVCTGAKKEIRCL